MMHCRVFVSYRRSDHVHLSGRLYDRFVSELGAPAVFRDIDGIQPGDDFRVVLERTLAQVDVLVVLIGPTWADRLSESDDFVRLEVAAALRLDTPIIPVLVDGAELPPEEALPPEIEPLLHHQTAIVRRDPDFHADVDKLIVAVRRFAHPQTTRSDSARRGSDAKRPAALAAIAGLCVLAGTAGVIAIATRDAPVDEAETKEATTTLVSQSASNEGSEDSTVESTTVSAPTSRPDATTNPSTSSSDVDQFEATVTIAADDMFVLYANGERIGDSWSTSSEAATELRVGQQLWITAMHPLDGTGGGARVELRSGNRRVALEPDRWMASALDGLGDDLAWIEAAGVAEPAISREILDFNAATPWVWHPTPRAGQIVNLTMRVTKSDLEALGGAGDSVNGSIVIAGAPNYSLDVDGTTVTASWMHAQTFIVPLGPGSNVIALEATNALGDAAVVARIETPGEHRNALDWLVTASRPSTTAWLTESEQPVGDWQAPSIVGRDGVAEPWGRIFSSPVVSATSNWFWLADREAQSRQQLFGRLVIDVDKSP